MKKNDILLLIGAAALILLSCASLTGIEGIITLTLGGAAFLFVCVIVAFKNGAADVEARRSFYIFLGILICGIVMRLVLAKGTNFHESDMSCFTGWPTIAQYYGLGGFYNSGYFVDYPPVYIYVMYLLGGIQNAVSSVDMQYLTRIPAIICDIVIALIVYKTAKEKTNNFYALLLFALVALNPAIMINSAQWAQVDSIFALFIVLVIYYLYKNKPVIALMIFAAAVLFKPQAVFIAPVIIIWFIYSIIKGDKKAKTLLSYIIGAAAAVGVGLLLILPFNSEQPVTFIIGLFKNALAESSYMTVNGFNIYALFGQNWQPLGNSMRVIGYVIIAAICAFSAFLFYKKRRRGKELLFLLAAYVIMGIYMFSFSMRERYTFVVPILLLFAFITLKDKRLVYLSIAASFSVIMNHCVSLCNYGTFIDYGITAMVSLINIAVFAYFTYAFITLDEQKALSFAHNKKTAAKKTTVSPMKLKTNEFTPFKNPLDKKDALILVIVCAAMAAFSFWNLGSFTAPQTYCIMNDDVVLELEEKTRVTDIRYYGSIGEGTFTLYYSEDGETYKAAEGETGEIVTTEYKNRLMYRWEDIPCDFTAEKVLLSIDTPGADILEIAVLDENGEIAPIKSVISGSATENPENLTDEQDMVSLDKDYMKEMYFDEIYHARTAYENIHGWQPYEITHPPLGKIILSLGINLFGMVPFGWRFMGTIFGVLLLPAIYILAKMLFSKRRYAIMAMALFAADFMRFAQTRIGTIDSYSVFFILCMFIFMLWFTKTNYNHQPLKKSLLPLFLCGVSFGLGAATKWLCIYSGAGLLLIFVITMIMRYKEAKELDSGDGVYILKARQNTIKTLLWCVLFFIAVPAVIYLLSYIPYTLVTKGDAYGFSEILKNQSYMLNYHANLNPDTVHPFSSAWYTWLLDIRPLLFYSNSTETVISTMSTMGNPFIWWFGLCSAFLCAGLAFRKDFNKKGLLFIALAGLSQILPWVMVTREVFIYHYFSTVPFLILLIIYVFRFLEEKYKWGRIVSVGFIAACIVLFICFYPVISGLPADAGYINGLRWLSSWPFY